MTPDAHYILQMNLSDATCTLHDRTRLGDVFPVKSLKKVKEMLCVDPRLSDWDSDDEVLLDMFTTSVDGSSDKGRYHCSNTQLNACMSSKDVPEYMQPLMEGLTEDLSVCDREELAGTIYNVQ